MSPILMVAGFAPLMVITGGVSDAGALGVADRGEFGVDCWPVAARTAAIWSPVTHTGVPSDFATHSFPKLPTADVMDCAKPLICCSAESLVR